MTKKFQIFVSSTYTDLIDERQAAVESILGCGHIPAGMELFSASDESQLEVIKRWIDESDIYVLILGGRYGSIEPKTGLSYTELEFNYALSIQKPFFSIVLSDEFIESKVKKEGLGSIERKEQGKLNDFRNKILNNLLSAIVKDIKDIKLAITNSIQDLQKRYDLTGWIRSTELITPSKNIARQIPALGFATPKFELIESFPADGVPISIAEIKKMFLKFSNPIDRNTACFIGILHFSDNCFYQWDNSGGIRYFDGNTKLVYLMSDFLKDREPIHLDTDDEFYRFEIHIGRGHPDTLIKDIYGNVLFHEVIRVFIKKDQTNLSRIPSIDKRNESSEKQLLIDAQEQYCETNGVPVFLPNDGYCFRCKNDILASLGLKELSETHITGCPLCAKSFCD